jgi:serine protease inhibitor
MAVLGSVALSRPSGARDTAAALESFVTAQNRFALAMYWQLTRDQDRFVFSPFSMSSMFAMALEGARGETAEEIERVIFIPRDRGERRSSYAALQPAARITNAVWMQNGVAFNKAYGDTLSRQYRAARTDVDFAEGVWAAKRAVDTWIENSTVKRIRVEDEPRTRITRIDGPADALVADHIPKGTFVGRGSIDIGVHPIGIEASRTTLILKFKDNATVADANRAMAAAGVEILGGTFKMVFAGVTDDGTFEPLTTALETLREDPAVEVAAMNPVMSHDGSSAPGYGRWVLASAATASGAWTSQVKHHPTPYSDIVHRSSQDGAVLLTLLISRTGSFISADRDLTVEKVSEWHRVGSISSNMPIPDMPVFNVKTGSPLRATLERMGMVNLFARATEDFSGIDREKESPIQSAAHHAMFSVTAQGFEAAAATAAGSAVVDTHAHASGSALPQPVVFVLQDAKTGLILFIGRAR